MASEKSRASMASAFSALGLAKRARDLLRDHEEIRSREQLRFRSIMVDEFQDTNRLQCELVDLLAREDAELFFVGDEFQSIYGFRHADLDVFRRQRDDAIPALRRAQHTTSSAISPSSSHVPASATGGRPIPISRSAS